MSEPRTWTASLPAGFRADAHRTLFQCGANARLHPMARHRITQEIRRTMRATAIHAGLKPIHVPVTILVVQHPAPGARTIDPDNVAPIAKAAIDGLRDARVLADDSPAYVTQVAYTVGDRVPGGQLVLHLTEITSEES